MVVILTPIVLMVVGIPGEPPSIPKPEDQPRAVGLCTRAFDKFAFAGGDSRNFRGNSSSLKSRWGDFIAKIHVISQGILVVLFLMFSFKHFHLILWGK